jgi:hypothetical protein
MRQYFIARLTDEQVAALNHFGGVNRPVGAVWFEGRWIFREGLRNDAALAGRYIDAENREDARITSRRNLETGESDE